ncbi:hypothetical protein G9A89_004302 [Geosiphon pyriformis]|nr:hypothetical protein G9A89_004302 [Geosiphon pyriformis]
MLEGAFIVIRECGLKNPFAKVAELVKKYLEQNQKTPEDLFECLNNKSSKCSIHHILLGFSLENGIGTIPDSIKAFVEFQKAANAENSFGQFFLGRCYYNGLGTTKNSEKAFELHSKAAETGTTKNLKKSFELFSKAAEVGHTTAQYNLGLCYLNGKGTTKNEEKAFELYSKAAEVGHTTAQYNLGLCYLNGKGTTKNSENAFELYLKAAEAGNTNAQTNLGNCYLNGEGTTKNSEKAFELFSKAAEAGDLDAQALLGCLYLEGWGTKKNSEKAYELYLKAAEAGNTNSQTNLRNCYRNGEGTTENEEKAFELYSKAVEMGDLDAQYNLGLCYINEEGTTKNEEKAFELFSKVAEAGDTSAQTNLGLCYLNGWGTTKNLKKAFELYLKAAEPGDTSAQINLGLCYDNGWGTNINSEKAFELFSKAAEAGNTNAQTRLGNCYLNGWGTTKNEEKAFELYSKVAEAGNTTAYYDLGNCYIYGRGTTKNLEKGIELYSKAAAAGNLLAKCQLNSYHRHRLEMTKGLVKMGNLILETDIGTYHRNGWETTKNLEKTFELYFKTAETENTSAQYNLGWCYQNGWGTTKDLKKAFELYLKADANKLSYQNDFPDLYDRNLTLENQDDLERSILQFQYRGFKCLDISKGEFLDFEAFFNQLSDEFKCLKCGNLAIIMSESPMCPFCDTIERDNIFKAGLPKCPECYSTLKDPLWCTSCEYSRISKSPGTWLSGNSHINQYINHTQSISVSCRGCLEWISPDEIKSLDKHERSGVTKVALKYLRNSQSIEYINSDEFFAHLQTASCKYILECYGITKDVTTDEFIMVLPFAEHGDLKAFLKMNENTLTWELFLCILFQIASGLRSIHESELVHGDLHPGNILVLKLNPLKVVIADLGFCRPANYSPQSGGIFGVVRYLAPEICNMSPHTKYSDIYSCAIISWEIISGERPWNHIVNPKHIQLYTILGERLPIQKHAPQCIQDLMEKNWDDKPHCRDSAEELQQRVIAARDNCNLNESIGRKRLNYKRIQGAKRDKSQKILSTTISQNELDLGFSDVSNDGLIHGLCTIDDEIKD